MFVVVGIQAQHLRAEKAEPCCGLAEVCCADPWTVVFGRGSAEHVKQNMKNKLSGVASCGNAKNKVGEAGARNRKQGQGTEKRKDRSGSRKNMDNGNGKGRLQTQGKI